LRVQRWRLRSFSRSRLLLQTAIGRAKDRSLLWGQNRRQPYLTKTLHNLHVTQKT
jgi:hypothetical protein